MSVSIEAIMLLGVCVGALSGIFGVGGGFLATPFLIFMGIPPDVAVGTQSNQLVASGVTGVMGHWKKKNVDVKMGLVMLSGSFVGSIVGIAVFRLLQHLGQIDLVISLLYVFMLGTIGGMMLFESLLSLMKKSATDQAGLGRNKWIRNLPYKIKFPTSRIYISAFIPAGIGFVGGVMVSIMGIGGGFILVPAMIYIIGMPTLLVAGTSLFQIIFTTAFSTVLHAVLNHTVDMVLASMLILSGVIGTQIGVKLSHKIKGVVARIILAILIISVSLELAAELFVKPENLFSVELR